MLATKEIMLRTSVKRMEELEDLLYFKLIPLKRLHLQRLDAMFHVQPDEDFDEAEYEEEVAKLLRVERVVQKVKDRLYPSGMSPLDLWLQLPDDAPLPSEL